MSVPSSVIEAMSKNFVLPMMIFFGLMGWAARAQKKAAAPMIEFCDSLLAVIFGYAHFVMKLAPVGMIAAVVAQLLGGGWKSVGSLARFVLAETLPWVPCRLSLYGVSSSLAFSEV